MENIRISEICNVIQRASMQKHLRSKKHLENIKQNELIIPEWLVKQEQTPIHLLRKKYKKYIILKHQNN